MRDIVFRGKEINPRGIEYWRYGWLCRFNNTTNGLRILSEDEFINCAVYPETVGQYTGLRDKRGKRIFEGDIIRRSGPKGEHLNNFLVIFEEGAFMLLNVKAGYDKWGSYHPFLMLQDWRKIKPIGMVYKIIGNKWDKSELLSR